MGYSHYFHPTEPCPLDAWKRICFAFRKVIKHADIQIANEWGDVGSAPVINDDAIAFNGIGKQGYETMALRRNGSRTFDCCKTGGAAYDRAVVALLSIAHHYAPVAWNISSDGHPLDWEAGVSLAKQATGEDIACPLSEH